MDSESDMDGRIAAARKLTMLDYVDIASGPIIVIVLLLSLLSLLLL
ncbi:MAG TPA: hypothetical protein VJR58_15785 [Vineibacter sp.]|nr:hypothetical protein [Vineibacter sp.]